MCLKIAPELILFYLQIFVSDVSTIFFFLSPTVFELFKNYTSIINISKLTTQLYTGVKPYKTYRAQKKFDSEFNIFPAQLFKFNYLKIYKSQGIF